MVKEICHLLILTSALVNKRLSNYLEMENDLPFSNFFSSMAEYEAKLCKSCYDVYSF